MITTYRSDARSPEELKSSGFEAKSPMTVEQARDFLLSYCTPKRTLLDLSQYIIASPKPEFISTDPSPDLDCGGKNNGYVYKIQFDDVSVKNWSAEVLGLDFATRLNAFTPVLLLNADTLAKATVIAIQHKRDVKEITFLTTIPANHILEYKGPEDEDFKPFPR